MKRFKAPNMLIELDTEAVSKYLCGWHRQQKVSTRVVFRRRMTRSRHREAYDRVWKNSFVHSAGCGHDTLNPER